MKVQPVEQNEQIGKDMRKFKHLKVFIWMTANTLGLVPYTVDKDTFLFSFKWFSSKTIFSILRLALFNILLTILPAVLFFLNYKNEWGSGSPGWMARGNGTITTEEVVAYVEYVANYSYFILTRLQKKQTIKCFTSLSLIYSWKH